MRTHRYPSTPVVTVILVLAAVLLLGGCSGESSTDGGASSTSGGSFPDITDVAMTADGDGSYSLDVTISSPYDSPERYADGWRVLDADGTELGTMTLAHDHASEQPFTRSQVGLEVPADVTSVTVEGHDQANGYGGATRSVDVPR